MSVPTIFANGCHLDLSLNGSRVAVIDSMKIKTLSTTQFHNGLKQSFNQNEVLPSITPSNESVASKNSFGSDEDFHQVQASPNSFTSREINIVVKEGSGIPDIQQILRCDQKNDVDLIDPDQKQMTQVWEREKSVVNGDEASNMSLEDDLWEDMHDNNQEEGAENIDKSNSATKLRKNSKRKRRKNKSRQSNTTNKTSKTNKNSIEDVYTDMAVLKRVSQLEAYCMPVKMASVNPYKQNLTKKLDYSKFINGKAPKAAALTQTKTDILIKRTKELIASKQLASSNSLKSASFEENGKKDRNDTIDIKLSVKDSVSSSQSGKILLSANTQPLIFRIKTSKSSHSVHRKLVGSAPVVDHLMSRLTKVYFSEKQSNDMEELGMEFPCAPPATPTPEMLKQYDYIPCMNDIRSQRAVKMKLDSMVKIEKLRKDKIKEEKMKRDKVHQKEKIKELRKQQRREIYALNKKMTEFEYKNFTEFCKQNGVPVPAS